MRKCSIMLALFIVVLLIASQFMKEEGRLNENLAVANKVQDQNFNRP
ncbi:MULTISPECIES: hypothetical protein [Maribacter]|nr:MULTISPECIES: hypothetical protein [Maribacter]MDF4220011.1 hypothetical protein [Maribacter huludaoensis]